MIWNGIKNRWRQLKGRVKQGWGRLTRNAATRAAGKAERIDGKREQLAEEVQERYVQDKALSEKELDDFTKSLETKDTTPPV